MKIPIKYKLSLIIFIILVPMLVFSFVHYFKMVEHDEHDTKGHNLNVAIGIADDLDTLVENLFNILSSLSKYPVVINRDSKECDRLFAELLQSFPEHLNIVAADMNGYNYGTAVLSVDIRRLNYKDREWFQKSARGTSVAGNLHISKLFKTPAVMIAVPVFNNNKRQTGVVGMSLNLVAISDKLSKKWTQPDKYSIVVIDPNGNILIDTFDKNKIGHNLKMSSSLKEALELKQGNHEVAGNGAGEDLFYSFSSLTNADWQVLISVPAAKVRHHAYMFNRDYLVLLLSVSFVALLLAFFFSRRIVRNINSLITGLKEAESGNLDFRLNLQGHDELTEVAESFNRTSAVIKSKEEMIMKSESFLESVLEGIGEGVIVIDRDYRIIMANKGYCAQVKMSCEDIIGMHCYKVSHHSDKACYENGSGCECTVKQCFETGEHHRAIHLHYDKNNNSIYIETNAYPLKDAAGSIVSAIETLSDVTDRVKLEKRLEEIKEQYRKLYDDAPDMMHSCNKDGIIIICNKTEAETLGYDFNEIMGQPLIKIIAPEELESCMLKLGSLKEKGSIESETTFIAKDGRRVPVFIKAKAIYDDDGEFLMTDAVIRDISDKKVLEAQLFQAQKMEAVGQLAGGIAHDFNNILTAIMGFGSMLQLKLTGDEKLRFLVDQILASGERAANLTRGLLAFSRKQVISPKVVRLSEVVSRSEKLLTRLMGEDIEFKTFVSPEEAVVMVDPGQIEQVLMNLATNARDAMPEGGALMIGIERVELDEEYVIKHAYAVPGKYMLLSVTDTGTGMDERTKEKMFEPFFTTKEVGVGTGLGLAMVYGIVKQSNGYINVYSEQGKGTTFKIYFPVAEDQAEELSVQSLPQVQGGKETLLIAEDEEALRNLLKNVLEEYGYKVVIAENGEEAVSKFAQLAGSVDLLILDVIMPKKNGKEVYDEIRKIKPDMKALFMSGYTADIIHKKGVLELGINIISKPFSPSILLRKIREALD